MIKRITILILSLTATHVHAVNGDSAIVEVLGVAPSNNAQGKTIQVYGGQTRHLYEMLPDTGMGSYERKVTMLSRAWAVEFYCHREYERPTTGETRYDYMCEISLNRRSSVHQEGWEAYPEDFSAYYGNNPGQVLGINPGDADDGDFLSFYGGNTYILASSLPERLILRSRAYTLTFSCWQDYQRPTTGEWRSDYMCTVTLN